MAKDAETSISGPKRRDARFLLERKLAEYSRSYGLGQTLHIASVLKLAKSTLLDRESRIEAWQLVAFLNEDSNYVDRAMQAYDSAFKLSRGKAQEVLIFKAALLRNEGLARARATLSKIDVSALKDEDRVAYWLTRMDTAKAAFDPDELQLVVREVWKQDRKENPAISADCEVCDRFRVFIRSNYTERGRQCEDTQKTRSKKLKERKARR